MKKEIDKLGDGIDDNNGFLISFKKDKFLKFDLPKYNEMIKIHYPQKEEFMEIGNSNIVIMKEKGKQSIYNSLESFDCPKDFKLFKDDRKTFILKRIIVLQCKETEESKQLKRQKRKKQIEKERNKLTEISENIIQKKRSKSNEIETSLGMRMEKLLFDTEYCDWSRHSTVFNEMINHANNLLIFIKNENEEEIECYLEKYDYEYKITTFTWENNEMMMNKLDKKYKYFNIYDEKKREII